MTAANLWSWRSRRLRIAVLCTLALTIEGLMRSNINMAMVCMLNENSLSSAAANNMSAAETKNCPMLDIQIGSVRRPPPGTLNWNSQVRGYIFTSFYLGGLFSCFFIEVAFYQTKWKFLQFLNRHLGAKRVVFYGAIANVVGTFLTPPVAANFHVSILILVRFAMGFGQGLLWPCMNVLVTHWFHANEKSTALAITTTGNQLSVIIAMFATAELCQLPFGGGWPMAFHVYGAVGVVLCILWKMYVTDCPTLTKGITEEELEAIHGQGNGRIKPRKADWKLLLKSPLIWAIAASSFAHNYITVGTVTYLPLYYRTVLKMSLSSNGLLSAVPFVFQLISKFLYSLFADGFKRKNYFSFTNITKICNTSASFGLAVCFFLLCFTDCTHRVWAVSLVCLAMAFVSGYVPGYNTSIVVVAPAQTAAVAAFSRIWGQIAATVAPYQIGALTKQGDLSEWRIIFATIVVICIISGMLYQAYGSAEEQEWAMSREPQLVQEEEDKRQEETADDDVEKQ